MTETDRLKKRFKTLTEKINLALEDAHRLGLSVFNNSNGYVQLSENELLTVDIGINECEHNWCVVNSIEQSENCGSVYSEHVWKFERCGKCSMTRNVR